MARSNDRILSPLVARLRRALRRQSTFSTTTALGCVYFALLAAMHLTVHEHSAAQAAPEVTLLLFALTGVAVALVGGRRLPRWAGMVLLLLLGAAFAAVVTLSTDAATVLGVLFLGPLLMVYLGWSYPAWPARGAAAVLIGLYGLAIVSNAHFAARATGEPWPLVYGALTCALVLEVSLALSDDLARAVNTDPLTGALNRRGLQRHVRETRQGGGQRWMLVADIDGLKPVNDRLGHAAGDALLRATVDAWRARLGANGVVGRWGGDEFVVVFRADGEAAARRIAAELRTAAPQPFSAGLVRLQDGLGLDLLVRLADEELYQHKRERDTAAGAADAMPVAPCEEAPRPRPWPAIVSIAAAALYVATAVVGLLSAQTAWQVVAEAVAVVIGLITIVVAVRLGHRYPHWGALAWVAVMGIAMIARLAARDDSGALIELLFCLQLFAVIAGWFYRGRVGRVFLAGMYAAVLVTLPFVSTATLARIGPAPTLVALVTAWLLLEVVRAVRVSERRLADTDPLTGALNRLGLDAALEIAIRRARRRREDLAYVAIDFNDFKELNDRNGHEAGDRALRGAVHAWRAMLRDDDVIGRLGGDEFAILLPRTGAADAAHIMDRLAAEAGGWSWGAAQLRPDDDAVALAARADAELYASKAARNR